MLFSLNPKLVYARMTGKINLFLTTWSKEILCNFFTLGFGQGGDPKIEKAAGHDTK